MTDARAAGGAASRVPAGLRAAALAAAAALTACSGGGSDGGGGRGAGTELAGALLPDARPKVDFTLTDTEGTRYGFRQETDGKLTLLFFGYTRCPDVCPVVMANLGAAVGRLPADVRRRIAVVFVSTDPARDSLPRIRSWLDNFHRSFVGLRGPEDKVNRIMESYGLPPAVREQPGGEGNGYTVGHAGQVLVFTPDDSLRLMYSPRTRQSEWVRDLRRLAREGAPAGRAGEAGRSGRGREDGGPARGAGKPGPEG